MTILRTVEDVVSALGGTQKTADLTNRSPQAVANWKRRGQLAQGTYILISTKLNTLGKAALPELWGMESDES